MNGWKIPARGNLIYNPLNDPIVLSSNNSKIPDKNLEYFEKLRKK
jgi:hypothetical protein